MAMISASDADYIRGFFAEKLTGDVTLELSVRPKPRVYVPGREDDCQYCEETKQLLEEVAELSEHVQLVVNDDAPREQLVPEIRFKGQNKGEMRYLGIPAGNEFRNLIDGIVEAGNGESGLSQETREALATLEKDIHLQVFVTPT